MLREGNMSELETLTRMLREQAEALDANVTALNVVGGESEAATKDRQTLLNYIIETATELKRVG